MGAVVSLATAPLSMAATCCGSICGSCAASMLCKACACSCVATQKMSSILYIGILMTFTMLALLFRYEGGDIVIGGTYNATAESIIDNMARKSTQGALNYWNDRFSCAPAHPTGIIVCCQNECGGVFAVYRYSFTLCLFFAFLALCTLGTTKFGARMHRGFWFLKVFLLFGVLFSTIFIDNHAMAAYRDFARVASILFLVVQILLLIDFGYRCNEWLVEMDEKSDNDSQWCNYKMGILVGAFCLYASSIAMWVVEANWFGKLQPGAPSSHGCAPQQTAIAFTIILTIVLSVISCTKIAPHGTLLTSAIVTAYASYLCYSALASHPDPYCNPMAARTEGSATDLLVGFLVFGVAMGSTAWSLTGSKEAIIGKTGGSDLTTSLETGASSTAEGGDPAAEDEPVGPESWWYYHVMMCVCTFYMAMLLTDWSTQSVDEHKGAHATSLTSFWVKLSSQWICLLMYGWTLLAPYLLRNVRDFGIEFDFD